MQSTVTALYGAIVNSLELSNLINSVLGTPSQYQPSSPTTHLLGNGSSDNVDQLNGALLMLASVNTPGNGHHYDLEERGESDIALPERLLASQGTRASCIYSMCLCLRVCIMFKVWTLILPLFEILSSSWSFLNYSIGNISTL